MGSPSGNRRGVDQNAVADVSPILGFLRDIQRRLETAVLLVHHARKSGATRPGQTLRGSSELHAWEIPIFTCDAATGRPS